MKKCFMTWGLLVLAVAARAETDFLKNLPPDEFTATGLQKLTPEDRANLRSLLDELDGKGRGKRK